MDVQAPVSGGNFSWQFYPTPNPQSLQGPPILQVIEELAVAKTSAKKRPEYIKELVRYLKQFSRGRENLSISDFTIKIIEQWFSERAEAASTQASNIGRLSSLFRFAVRRGYIEKNPCDKLERITVDRAEPPILSSDQIISAMQFATAQPPRFLLWFVLAGIIGLRPSELRKLDEAALKRNLSEGLLIIDSLISKVRHRRVIELTGHSHSWLEFALSEPVKLPFAKSFIRRSRNKLKDHLKLPRWPQDILRHTALSYMIADYGDETRVAREAGNSVNILRSHYFGIVKPSECEAFQNVLPEPKSVAPQLEFDLIILPPGHKPIRARYHDLDLLPPKERAVARVKRWRERERYAIGLSQRGRQKSPSTFHILPEPSISNDGLKFLINYAI